MPLLLGARMSDQSEKVAERAIGKLGGGRRCSFCGKARREVRGMVERRDTGTMAVAICNECVGLCVDALSKAGHYP